MIKSRLLQICNSAGFKGLQNKPGMLAAVLSSQWSCEQRGHGRHGGFLAKFSMLITVNRKKPSAHSSALQNIPGFVHHGLDWVGSNHRRAVFLVGDVWECPDWFYVKLTQVGVIREAGPMIEKMLHMIWLWTSL